MSVEWGHMTIEEFRNSGLLQEVNRLVLHPCGVALSVEVGGDGAVSFGPIFKDMAEPEGITFGVGVIDPEKAARVAAMIESKMEVRKAMFGGTHIQPVGVSDGVESE